MMHQNGMFVSKNGQMRGTQAFSEYEERCYEDGEQPCVDTAHHVWVVSDENENHCYCEKCGCAEY